MPKFDWTLENCLQITEMHKNGAELSDIADKVGTSEQSVRCKLVALKVYQAKPKAKPKANRATKADTVKAIEIMLSVREGQLAGLDAVTNKTLNTLKDALIKASDQHNAKAGI